MSLKNPVGRPPKEGAIATNMKLRPLHRWWLERIGKGDRTAGAEAVIELCQLLSDCYRYVPEELQERIESAGIVEAIACAPDEFCDRDEDGNIVAWRF